jgi:hypothetical protein
MSIRPALAADGRRTHAARPRPARAPARTRPADRTDRIPPDGPSGAAHADRAGRARGSAGVGAAGCVDVASSGRPGPERIIGTGSLDT